MSNEEKRWIDQLPRNCRLVLERFVAACRADDRVVAAFLTGSYAAGTADVYSDIDLYLITTDEGYHDFLSGRDDFVRLMDQPHFLEDFGSLDMVFVFLADGTEIELMIGRESLFQHRHGGPYKILLDKTGVLEGGQFTPHEIDPAERKELLRQQIEIFWHDLGHFLKAIARGNLWFAIGQLEVLRAMCVNLARLSHDFSDPGVGDEPYFKVEEFLPVAHLAPLQATFCPMDRHAILTSALSVFQFYRQLARPLAEAHGVFYSTNLERILGGRLQALAHNR